MRKPVLVAVLAALALLVPEAAGARPADPPGPARSPARAAGIPPLTDEHGRTLTLRGWNVEDKAHRGADALSAVTERHFRDMAAAGFNTARLLVFWDDLEPERGQYSERYLRKIERILGWAQRHRVRVVIDAHQDVYGPAFGTHRGIPEWATRTDGLPYTPNPDDWFSEYFQPAVQAAFEHLYEDADLQRAQARMWQVLARRLARQPAVLGYDLINEPMGRIRDGEELPTAARRIEREQLTPMYNRIADAVREVDRRSWLFVEPTPIVGEGVPTGLGRIDDPKVVYAPHFYNAAMEAGRDYDPSAGWIEAYEAAVTRYPRERGVPVVVGEWGPLNNELPLMGRFYEDALASMDRYSSGWAGYVWCYGGGYCAVDRDGRFRRNKERTARPYAPAVSGAVRSDAYDPAAGRYRLAYAPRRLGTTELSLPPTATGWRIRVAGPAATRTRVVRPGERGTVLIRARPTAHSPVTVTVTPRG
ncbi:cellulase family glycosylhydrolase [Streptomyces sp. H27-D2]|uniref:cellulase family glycosylhydrolase n=1 Tax=Streptomyces sp. H27-D2 TaxID=3046304 RepID=UPI002DBD6FC8|nr:cellulase family glycosylhydrolase [Streptomyces sp. H27-D2]MEC4018686.1 cellulase family glycosylhydrolase [Streptomyces sp. H27-D2]